MYDELVKRLREIKNEQCYIGCFGNCGDCKIDAELEQAADAIEELQATLCTWCAVCPGDKRDLSTCEIYESCRAKPPKEET